MEKECTIRNYSIPGNDEGGRIFIYGKMLPLTEMNRSQERPQFRLLFFCGGYPDDCSSFQSLAQRFSASNEDIICGVTCLPGYDVHHDNFKKEGYSFDEMVLSLKAACKLLVSLVLESTSLQLSDIELTGIFHDWGSYVGAMLVNRMNLESPQFFRQVVYLDVLPPLHPALKIPRQPKPLSQALVIVAYTGFFAFCHATQRFFSSWVATTIATIGYSLFPVLGISPVRFIDNKTFMKYRPKEYTMQKLVSMQYPYYNMWHGMLSQGTKEFLKSTFGDVTLPANISSPATGGTPVLYMYGTNKNSMFHDAYVLDWLKEKHQPVIEVRDAGHWFHRQQEDICYEAILNFLAAS
jgi:pimeloyl-ACP methyl ester carboxylesterase